MNIQRRRASVGLLCVCLLFAPTVASAGLRPPYIPAADNVVLQRVPSSTDPRVRRFEALRKQVAGAPTDLKLSVRLARAYIDYGRSTGDARFLGRALAVIDPWMRRPDPPIPAMILNATILQSRHQFRASRKELREILKRDPENPQAWLTLATVAMVQGDFPVANRSCVRLASVGGDFMGIVCTAALRSVTGHADQAYRLLTMIQDPGPEAPPAIKAWTEGLMADAAKRLGRTSAANAHFRKALQFAPGDNFLLADYADFLLDQGKAAEALSLVKDYPQSDTSFLRQVFAEAALGKPRASRDIEEMARRFHAMDRRGSHVYRREQARFVLYLEKDPQRALQLAEKNWTVQRAPEDVRIYLEAALAAGRPSAARPALALVARSHLEGPHIDRLVKVLTADIHRETAASESQRPQD